MKEVAAVLPGVIEELSEKGESYFGFSLPVSAHIFTGLYASNAFVDHQMEMYFAIEKLSQDPSLLRVIVAHEMIHSYHYHLLGHAGIDWQAIDWSDVRNSLYLEGVATYLSEKLVPGHPQHVYFSYEDEGEDWLDFCKQNHKKIAAAFLADLDSENVNMEKEWLRLSGGQHFGYNRLGYYLGTTLVRDLLEELQEEEMLKMLAEKDVAGEVDRWLRQWG
ncbi:aminopeptidase [Lentibacillus sediminis]|uniref:aminopeptidase n=1 Tax=Lentibacillus sediminis TaxID=1940529 RepID=UPI000C1BD879|nr:aminopeptidase [Lentibacillus sediminis]